MIKLGILILMLRNLHSPLPAETVDYRTWYASAKNTFNRGKSTYEAILKEVQEREDECIIRHQRDSSPSQISNSTGHGDTETGSFTCLNQLQQTDSKSTYDIDDDVAEISNASWQQRVLAEGGCWQYVLKQVNALDIDKCDVKGEVSRSLIALAKTKCHFIRSGRAFPLAHHGCLLNPTAIDEKKLGIFTEKYETNPCRENYYNNECEKLKAEIVAQCTNPLIMSESAFQMYHADLNHIDDICFYLQSGEWNRRTEVNINRLGEAAIKLINSQQIIESFLKKVQKSQDENIQKANKLTTWMDSLRDDVHDVFNILEIITSYQRKIFDFVHNFKVIFVYSLYVIIGIAMTLFEATSWARPRIVLTIASAGALDSLSYKVCTQWLQLEPYGVNNMTIYKVASSTIKWIAGVYSATTWIRALLSYQQPAQAMLKEMYQIRKILTPRVVYPNMCPVDDETDDSDTEVYRGNGYSLDDFVELFGDHSDSTYSYESGYTTTESCSDSLGEDSEGLVEEYLDTLRRRRKNALKYGR